MSGPEKLGATDKAFFQGAAMALAELHRLLAGGNDSSGVCEVARNFGLTLKVARACRVGDFDLRELRKAGVR